MLLFQATIDRAQNAKYADKTAYRQNAEVLRQGLILCINTTNKDLCKHFRALCALLTASLPQPAGGC